ncbi:alpha-E domain-containing protein [Roseomonas sp. BN140053]|uniref:alpha-E domain-containing protein n=1 Tax=Roseomonas sp. BN140053 TaxID=3391898 RepID=UPI0039E84366
MLARTADSLFWVGRYSERAGNIARGLSASLRMASLTPAENEGGEWQALLLASGTEGGFRATHPAPVARDVVEWLTLDTANPSSIASCLEAARRNARAVRTALTVDMWEAVNDTWIELQRTGKDVVQDDRLAGFLDWVKSRSLAFNGAAADTMLRDDAWRFTHLGTMLERADNTARLLDARHAAFASNSPAHHVQWQSALRSVSAMRAYQHVFRARLEPTRVAELLLLRREMPRSLRFCYSRVDRTLAEIAAAEASLCGDCRDLSGRLLGRCEDARIEDILARGLHDFLTGAINDNIRLGAEIGRCFLVG